MVVLDSVPGIEVTVLVGGSKLLEYQDESIEDSNNEATRYIRAESGKNFKIHVRTTKGIEYGGVGVEYSVSVDGNETAAGITEWPSQADDVWRNIGAIAQPGKVRKYRFQDLETVEAPRATGSDRDVLEGLGTIKIEVRVLKSIGDDTDKAEESDCPTTLKTVAEKDSKGGTLSHSVSYDRATKDNAAGTWCDVETLSDEPLATFNFRYRSLGALKALHIIPRSPSPEPLERRDHTTLSQEEIQQLQQRVRELKEEKANAAKIKKEAEEEARPRKRARRDSQVEVIVLD